MRSRSDNDSDIDLIPDFTDALEEHRKQDAAYFEPLLKKHERYGEFFQKYWNKIKDYLILEEIHQDNDFIKQDDVVKKVYILIKGEVAAGVITAAQPDFVRVYDYHPGDLLSSMGALFYSKRKYGFRTISDSQLVSIDLKYIEDLENESKMYGDLIELLYTDTLEVNIEILNYRIKNNIDLKDLLKNYELFHNISELSDSELKHLSKIMRYIRVQPNEIVLGEANNKNLYIIESGTVIDNNNNRELYRNDIIGQHNLDLLNDYNNGLNREIKDKKDNNILAETECCLLEINYESLSTFYRKDSFAAQIIHYFERKNELLNKNEISKFKKVVIEKDSYITYFRLCLMVIIGMSLYGVFNSIRGSVFNYEVIPSDLSLVLHFFAIAVMTVFIVYICKPYAAKLNQFGFTTYNLTRSLTEAVFFGLIFIAIVTAIKDIYIYLYAYQYGHQLFTPDLVVNSNLNVLSYSLFLVLFVLYIMAYEFCVRGVIQGILLETIHGSRNFITWSSVLASSLIGSQFHISLFHEFSLMHLFGNIITGFIFVRTRNLWACMLFHCIFSIYILTILGLSQESFF